MVHTNDIFLSGSAAHAPPAQQEAMSEAVFCRMISK